MWRLFNHQEREYKGGGAAEMEMVLENHISNHISYGERSLPTPLFLALRQRGFNTWHKKHPLTHHSQREIRRLPFLE